MDWLNLLREALDEAHDDHDEACDCYERLCDGLEGVYRFPPRNYSVALPPVYGCKTPMEAAIDSVAARIAEGVFATAETLRSITGLDACLPP